MTAALLLGLGVLLALPARARPAAPASEAQARAPAPGLVERFRLLWAACAVAAGVTLLVLFVLRIVRKFEPESKPGGPGA